MLRPGRRRGIGQLLLPSTAMKTKAPQRCHWARSDGMIVYHDQEWGVPLHDDRMLFEALVLDGAQAGLSWETILRKRENYRRAFQGFDPAVVAQYGKREIDRFLGDEGIVRNRLKIESAIKNACAFLKVQEEFGTFDKYIWGFVGGKPMIHRRRTIKDVPATSPQSDAMSKDLKARGFTFVGSTICYAMMQATGMVNDHLTSCFRYKELVHSR